jgi:hypothetical protein
MKLPTNTPTPFYFAAACARELKYGRLRVLFAYFLPALLAITMAVFAGSARADVWGYVDVKGVAHFSAERLDERYELFFRGNESFTFGKGEKATAFVHQVRLARRRRNYWPISIYRPTTKPSNICCVMRPNCTALITNCFRP